MDDNYPKGVFFVGRLQPGDDQTETRQIVGTAFLVFITSASGFLQHLYVVTAAHVVDGAEQTFVRIPMHDGSVNDVPVPEWVPHSKYDVAVGPIKLPSNHGAVGTELEQFIDDDRWNSPSLTLEGWGPGFRAQLGDAVYFIGLLGKIEAMTKRNIPIVRAGTLGRLWQENLPVQRTPHDTPKYITAHLIDCRSFAGFSGSPCYVQQLMISQGVTDGRLIIKERTALLGLIGGHFDDWARTRERDRESDKSVREEDAGYSGGVSDNIEARVSTGVGYVIPAEFIRETLMLEEFVGMRKKAEHVNAPHEEPATMDVAPSTSSTSEFERFEDLARKLVNTPKAETDEKRKAKS